MKSSLSLIMFTCALIMPAIRSHIIVRRKYTDQLIEEFYDLPALFGSNIPSTGVRVYPLEAYPDDGCTKQPTPQDQLPNEIINNRKFVLIIARNNCSFEEKIRNAQNGKYDAAIVFNMGSDDLEQMSAKNSSGIIIPAVFIGETSGRYIIDYYIDDDEYVLIINDALPFNINKNLIIPFSILVGLCFIIMIFYMIYKCVREQRRLNQHRLPKRLLKRIPVIKFAEGHPYESCIICLEDYTKGERIRVLPCNHAYHCHCIDVWLTKNRRVCPICKRRVFVRSEWRNQSRRRPASSDSTTDTDEDVQPLINNYNSNNHGTFPQNGDNQQDNNGNQRNLNNPSRAGEHPVTDDDDNVLNNDPSRISNESGRENPFNRNMPIDGDQITVNPNANGSGFWNFFKFRFLRRSDSMSTPLFNEVENPIALANDHDDVPPIPVNVPRARTASNNILNANLSGSFQDSNPIASSSTSAPSTSALTTVQISNLKKKSRKVKQKPSKSSNLNRSDQQHHQSTSSSASASPSSRAATASSSSVNQQQNTDADVFIQTPSQGGIGVAALPNTNLNQSTTKSGNNQRNFFI